MKKFGEKVGKSAQAVNEMQKRERQGTITLNSLKTVAGAINMNAVYAIIPIDEDEKNDLNIKGFTLKSELDELEQVIS